MPAAMPDLDPNAVLAAALAALDNGATKVPAAWPRAVNDGQHDKWNAAEFTHGGERWIVCQGDQDIAKAQMLEATMAFKAARGADKAITIIAPDPNKPRDGAPEEFAERFRARAWRALDLLWAVDDGTTIDVATAATGGGEDDRGEFDAIRDSVGRELADFKRDQPSQLAQLARGTSPAAEGPLRDVVRRALLPFGFELRPDKEQTFQAFWRRAKTDGKFVRDGDVFPNSLALEVKVGEDTGAPLCQVCDDLGQFDAVIYIRLTTDVVRKGIEARVPAMREAVKRLEERAPLAVFEVDA